MPNVQRPLGQLFTHVYLERTAPLSDGKLFRERIGSYCAELASDLSKNPQLATFLIRETGKQLRQVYPGYFDIPDFFRTVERGLLLNAITLCWRFFDNQKTYVGSVLRSPTSPKWLEFVQRALKEENLHYTLDSQGGVHYLIDEEFERNFHSVLSCLEGSRYNGVRHAFEAAYRHLDVDPADTKASVRSMFEALEIMVKLMIPDAQNLSRFIVEKRLKSLVQGVSLESTAAKVHGIMLDSLSSWVDAMHNYRHGQASEEIVAPPMDLAVFILSSGTSYLRWMATFDRKNRDSA